MKQFELKRITLRQANAWVATHHRHSGKVRGHLFSIAAAVNNNVVGVAIVGRPTSRILDAMTVAEITRVCTNGAPNACSFLYGAATRAAIALGFKRVITYTHQQEPGTSLRAAGFKIMAEVHGRQWDTPSRPRNHRINADDKYRWELPLDV